MQGFRLTFAFDLDVMDAETREWVTGPIGLRLDIKALLERGRLPEGALISAKAQHGL